MDKDSYDDVPIKQLKKKKDKKHKKEKVEEDSLALDGLGDFDAEDLENMPID